MPGSLKNSSSVKSPYFPHKKLKMPGIKFCFDRKMRPSMESQPSILLLMDVGPRNGPFFTTLIHRFLPHPTLLCKLNRHFSLTWPLSHKDMVNHCLILLMLRIVVIKALHLKIC